MPASFAVAGDQWKMSETPHPDARLVLFTRYPVPGTTKTRLIPALGPERAADLQRQMTEYLVAEMNRFCTQHPASLEIRYTGASKSHMQKWLPDVRTFRPQGEGGLGTRLSRAFAHGFTDGVPAMVMIGADCPGITPSILAQAFSALTEHDLVLGPAVDGGYYLIGLRRHAPRLFRDMPWGSGALMQQTMAVARTLNLTVSLLEQLADVDRPEDVRHFRDYPHPQ